MKPIKVLARVMRVAKSIFIPENSEIPSLSLKECQIKGAFSSWLVRTTIRIPNRGDGIPVMLNRSICMEEPSALISKFHPFNGSSLFPVNILQV
jgi:hypothetical protein